MNTGSVTPHRDHNGRVRWRVRLTVDGKRKSLGLRDTEDEARRLLAAALEQLAGEEKGVTLLAWGEVWLQRRATDGLHRPDSQQQDGSSWHTHVASAPFAGWPMRKIRRVDVVRWVKSLLRKEAVRARVVRKKGGDAHEAPGVPSGESAGRLESGADTQTSALDARRAGVQSSRPPRVVLRKGLGRTLARQTAVNAFNLLSRSLGDAADDGLIPANPAAGVRVPKKARDTDAWTYLDADEIFAALSNCDSAMQSAIVGVAIFTGLRAGELWGLRWCDVRLEGNRPHLHVCKSYRGPTKGGRPRAVPLLSPAIGALRMWHREAPGIGEALVFPAEGRRRRDGRTGCHSKGYDAGWSKLRVRARIERNVRFHDLRHTCASHLVMGSWTPAPWRLEDVRDVLGHKSITTTERYAHLAPDRLHGLAERARSREHEG